MSRSESGVRTATLSKMSGENLRQCLEPIVNEMEGLDAEAFLGLTRVECGALLKSGIYVRPIHNDITPDMRRDDAQSVRYIHIREVACQYSMGIFVFPPHAKIPLHDHPGMCVISRLLYGTIRRLSLDLLPTPNVASDTNNTPKKRRTGHYSWLPWSASWSSESRRFKDSSQQVESSVTQSQSQLEKKQNDRKIACYRANSSKTQDCVDLLSAPDCTILFPWEGNLHEFTAGPDGAAILDVLLPPYDAEHDRDCTFYKILDEEPVTDNHDIKDDGDMKPERFSCWIAPTNQPDDFHCIAGQYKNLGRDGS